MNAKRCFLPSFVASTVVALFIAGCGGETRVVEGSTTPTADAGLDSRTGTQTKATKLDLLFAIDNSPSMGDKQRLLLDAVPDLVSNLVTHTGVTDIHVGVVSSSLGAFGDSAVCTDAEQQNDHGHLLNRTSVSDAPAGFLAWFPGTTANVGKAGPATPTPAVKDQATLIADFQGILAGVGQQGCGLQAQLESWYHFLIQPDPWQSITIDGDRIAHYTGVDQVILSQRRAFLRPDSMVAVIMLTDKDDSFSDPLAIGGEGWAFSAESFPQSSQPRTSGNGFTAPLPTTACARNPADPACTTCGFAKGCNASDPACKAIQDDANCKRANGGYYAGDQDSLNVRFFHMKQRFGIDPQYPIDRYVSGLRRGVVPKGSEEHDVAGTYQTGAGSCQNPLFAAALPASANEELCNLAVGPRSPQLVFFEIIGGLPNQLLHFDPENAGVSRLTTADWTKLLGNDPAAYDYTGIDPHMVQSITPRAGLPAPSATSGDNGTDPIQGREWDTAGSDLQYACTFPLAVPEACAKMGDPSCGECNGTSNPPLCGADPLQRVRGKAYPTVRELQVARALGDQGVAASLCPRTVNLDGITPEPESQSGVANPLYGYRPAMKALVDRMKPALVP